MPWLVKTVRQQSGDRVISSLEPGWTQTTCQDMGLVSPAFIAELHGTSRASGMDDPMLCVTAGGNHHALLSVNALLTYYYGTQQASGLGDPVHTVTGIDRAALVGSLEKTSVEDLTFRMLKSHEVGKVMAFPGKYVVLGTERDKVKQYGNAVTPPAMEMLLKRCKATLE
jgi:DNA (cytosine-5)-methyltransferase 1